MYKHVWYNNTTTPYLSELSREIFELVEVGLVVVEVVPDGLDQLQVPLLEVLRYHVAVKQLGRPGKHKGFLRE